MTSGIPSNYEQELPNIIEKTNIYEKIAILHGNQKIQYGWKFKQPGIIYRLKDFLSLNIVKIKVNTKTNKFLFVFPNIRFLNKKGTSLILVFG